MRFRTRGRRGALDRVAAELEHVDVTVWVHGAGARAGGETVAWGRVRHSLGLRRRMMRSAPVWQWGGGGEGLGRGPRPSW